MKFKKDGKVFEDIQKARMYYCKKLNTCSECVFDYAKIRIDCYFPCKEDPIKSAQLMGFEVIEDEEDKMELPHEIGSMTLAQVKEYCKNHCTYNNKNGEDSCKNGCELAKRNICGFGFSYDVQDWNLDRPRLTPEELEICRALGAKWVTYNKYTYNDDNKIILWADKPTKRKYENGKGFYYTDGIFIAQTCCSCFPSLKPGDCINVEELMKG